MTDGFHQLLVIGNGFDLQCGLKSTFNDFYESKKIPDTETINNILEDKLNYHNSLKGMLNDHEKVSKKNYAGPPMWALYCAEHGITIWDYILRPAGSKNWSSIEETLQEWLSPGKDAPNHIDKTLELINSDKAQPVLHEPDLTDHDLIVAQYFANGYEHIEVAKPTYSENDLLEFIKDQLTLFEKQFEDFLRCQIRDTPTYDDKWVKMMSTLITDERPQADANNPPTVEMERLGVTSVLNFNYTGSCTEIEYRYLFSHLPPYRVEKYNLNMVNVHGELVNGIVFGIDGGSLSASDEHYADLVRFTKTYRLMGLPRREDEVLVREHVVGVPGSETGLIKFYGHSLSQADYSYFQALFDAVDLYESRTRLVFYYNVFRGKDGVFCEPAVAQKAMFEKVINLMNRYGATLDNPDHGRNLLHKLLLERRLAVKRFPD